MVNIYTSSERLEDGVEIVKENDAFFETNTRFLMDDEYSIIKEIDNAEIIEGNTIKTPYGVTDISNLSSGCKTVINVIRNPDIVFDITDCGPNAINCLFRIISDTDIRVILRHNQIFLEEGIVLNVNGCNNIGYRSDFILALNAEED